MSEQSIIDNGGAGDGLCLEDQVTQLLFSVQRGSARLRPTAAKIIETVFAAAPSQQVVVSEGMDTWKSVTASLTPALADERDYSLALRALLIRSREYVADALEAHEHSDGRALLSGIDAALKAQGASEGAGETEREARARRREQP